ncbi:MAG: hypothetical protein QNJ62_06640 [Methyloceanibacter sp.]|nr:hypothetical protein [Methyloceanibacter sp.]
MNDKQLTKPELTAGHAVAPIVPHTVEEVARIAEAVIRADLAPDSYWPEHGGLKGWQVKERYRGFADEERKAIAKDLQSKIMVGIMKGAEVGLPPITALSWIAIINGRPSIWGDGAISLVQRTGQLENSREWFEPGIGETESPGEWDDTLTACCALKRKGQDDPYIGRFSVRDAKRAKLWMNPKKDPWMKYPQRMLMWRARTYAMRDGFADCLAGLSIAEEMQDLPTVEVDTDTSFLDDAAETPEQIEARPEAQEPEETEA